MAEVKYCCDEFRGFYDSGEHLSMRFNDGINAWPKVSVYFGPILISHCPFCGAKLNDE